MTTKLSAPGSRVHAVAPFGLREQPSVFSFSFFSGSQHCRMYPNLPRIPGGESTDPDQ
jgi:hypothetical protein